MARHRAGAVASAGWPSLLRGLRGRHWDGDPASYCRGQADGRRLGRHGGGASAREAPGVAGRSHLVWVQRSAWLAPSRELNIETVFGRRPPPG